MRKAISPLVRFFYRWSHFFSPYKRELKAGLKGEVGKGWESTGKALAKHWVIAWKPLENSKIQK
jgi:hypothetical protein